MQKNETPLTPIFRYVFENLQGDLEASIGKLKVFEAHIHKDIYENDTSRLFVVQATIELLRCLQKGNEFGQKFWQEKYDELSSSECSACSICLGCRVYFWKEIREKFFGIVNDEKNEKKYFPVWPLPDDILNHLDSTMSAGLPEIYHSYAKRTPKKDYQNKMLMLKGLSSSTPSLLNSIFDTDTFVGGGLYVCWQGYGIAIDPGYSFVRNLHHYGLSVLDIDAVIITHEHIDHNNDMRLLDDLHHSVARYAGKAEHYISWYMDSVTYKIAKILQENKAGFSEKENCLYCIEEKDFNKNVMLKEEIVEASFFQTRHILDDTGTGYRTHSFGCRLICHKRETNREIVYTSDTRYFPELIDQINNADIVIANISGIYEDDFMLIKDKQNHLGYFGCYRLIYDCFKKYKRFPKIYILSEFWNGKSDIRFDVSKYLRKQLSENGIQEMSVIPGEVGLVLDIEEIKSQCTQCGRFSEHVLVRRPEEMNTKMEIICENCCF